MGELIVLFFYSRIQVEVCEAVRIVDFEYFRIWILLYRFFISLLNFPSSFSISLAYCYVSICPIPTG